MNSENILAVWNVILGLLILYSPGIICGVVMIACINEKKKSAAILTGVLTVLLLCVSSVVLYFIIDFMLSW